MVQMFMWDFKKVSALWSVRFRGSSLERFCYKGFLRTLSGTKIFVRLREVSALEDVRFREVPLYKEIDGAISFLTSVCCVLLQFFCVLIRYFG